MSTVMQLQATGEEWVLASAEVPSPDSHQVKLKVLRSLFDLTGSRLQATSVPVIGRVIESTPQGPAVDSLVLALGSHSSECIVPALACTALPDGCSESQALLGAAIAPALAHLRRVNLEIGSHAVVLGLDFLGLVLVSLCRLGGAGAIGALDARPECRALAEKLSSARVASPEEPGWQEVMVQGSTRDGADVVFATRPDSEQVEAIIPHCRKEARILLLAPVPTGPLDLYHTIHTPGRTLLGPEPEAQSVQHWAADCVRIMGLMGAGRYSVDCLVGESVPASQVTARMSQLLETAPSATPTVVLDWEQ